MAAAQSRKTRSRGAIWRARGNSAESVVVVAEITAAGGRAMTVQADLADPKAAPALLDAAEAGFGAVDVLVNNAGIMRLAPIGQADDALFDAHVAINLGGVFRGLREAANRLRDGGRVVNFSSSVVGVSQPGYGVYAATTAAVEAMTRVLAKELGPREITVNAVAPGPVATELLLSDKSAEQVAAVTRMIPAGRLGEPDDIARVVSFLAGPDGGWINGQVIRANGGMI
jgi:3-oxoacyl-[acyl-carrier protein] reductase